LPSIALLCDVRSDVRAAPIRLDCAADGMDRYFTLRYVNDDVTVGALFFVDIQGTSLEVSFV